MLKKLVKLGQLSSNSFGRLNVIPKRNSGTWMYRLPPNRPPKINYMVANAIGGFFYWWVFWHLWHQFDHITGEFEYPDRLKWTDEELGIPPDE